MNATELEQVFRAADDKAQKALQKAQAGDPAAQAEYEQAAEDAAIFAAELEKFYSNQGRPGVTSQAKPVGLGDIGKSFLEAGKDVVRGAAKSASSLVQLAAPGAGFGPSTPFGGDYPDVQELMKGAAQQAGERGQMIEQALPTPEGRGPERQALQNFLEGAGGAMVPPLPGGQIRQAVSGGMGNLMAGEVAAGGGSQAQQVAAALAAGLATGVPGTGAVRPPPITRAIQGAAESVAPGTLRAAEQATSQASQTLGVPTLLQQGLPDPTSFQELSKGLLQNPNTAGQAHQLLNKQLPAALGKTREFIEGISPTIPGQREAGMVRDAAVREVSQRPDDMRQALTKTPYAKGARETFPVSVRFSAPQDVADVQQVMRVLEKSDAGRAFLGRYKRLIENSPILQASGKPFVKLSGEPMELYNFRKELSKLVTASSKEGAAGTDVTKAVGYQKMIGALDDLLAKNAPELVKANALAARAFRQKDAIQQGVLGKVAPGGKDELQQPAEWDQLTIVLQNPNQYSPADIDKLTKSLYRANPKAPALMLRQYLESRFDSVLKADDGRLAPGLSSRVADTVFGQPGTAQNRNVMQMVESLAQANGRNGRQAKAGLQALTDALYVVSRDKKALGSFDMAEAERAAQGPLGKFFRGAGWTIGKAIGDAEVGKMYQELFRVLSTPGGVQRLEEIAQFSIANNRVRAAAAVLRAPQSAGSQQGWAVN